MSAPTYNWQQKGWPRFTYNRAHLSDELSAFAVDLGEPIEPLNEPLNARGSKKTGGYYIKQ